MKTRLALSFLLLFLLAGNSMQAQDIFNPGNPPEPFTLYKVTALATPADKAQASGTGRYKAGARVYINASAKDTDYEFKCWNKDGAQYSTSRSFYYTVAEEDVTFEAVYELINFDPANPADPNMDYKRKVYLESQPGEACSFNINSGSRYSSGAWVTVTAHPSQGFEFIGWYSNGALQSTSLSFNYEMTDEDAHLSACFRFNPDSPGDPFSDGTQSDVDTGVRGDVTGDGKVDVSDVTAVVNHFLSADRYNARHDVNKDGKVDVSDATSVVNIYLGQ